MLLIAALCWSLGGVLIKYLEWPAMAVAGGRGVIAALFLAALCRPLRFTWSPVQIGAALAYAACTITFVAATKLTTAANAILLQYTAPIHVALLGAWILKERATAVDWATIVVALFGMSLFFIDELDPSNTLGNGVAIVSGVFFALLAVLLRKQKEGSPAESIILGNLIAAVCGIPWLVGAGIPSGGGILALLGLGVIQLGVSYLLYSRAIRHVTAMEAVLIPVIEPILNPIWTLLMLGEKPGKWAIVGGLVVLAAVTLRSVLSVRSHRAPGAPVTT
jgi:drug/metabolite transporter (DMT)-like permease